MALTTLANVKQWLGIATGQTTDDALLTRLITAVSGAAERYIGRTFAVASHDEYYTGRGERDLVLNHFPVASITSLTVDGETITAYSDAIGSGYVVRNNSILSLNGYRYGYGEGNYNNVHVVYSAGEAAPSDLEQAVVDWVSDEYRRRDRIGQKSKILAGETVFFTVGDIPDAVKGKLDRIRDSL